MTNHLITHKFVFCNNTFSLPESKRDPKSKRDPFISALWDLKHRIELLQANGMVHIIYRYICPEIYFRKKLGNVKRQAGRQAGIITQIHCSHCQEVAGVLDGTTNIT